MTKQRFGRLIVVAFIFFVIVIAIPLWDGIISVLLLLLASFYGYKSDYLRLASKKSSWRNLAVFACFYFVIVPLITKFWTTFVVWEIKTTPYVVDLNTVFKNIPYNDASFTRFFHPNWFESLMAWSYRTGFVSPFLIAIIRALATNKLTDLLKYMFASPAFQFLLAIPFYTCFKVYEVWYVTGQPDYLNRSALGINPLSFVTDCFPSLHTSCAVAVLILSQRSASWMYKYLMSAYCCCIIYSTMFLQVHWIIDVAAGIVFGYVVVRLVDFVSLKLDNFYYFKRNEYDNVIHVSEYPGSDR